MTASPGEQDRVREPPWGWDDLALLTGSILPALLAGAVLTRIGKEMLPGIFSSRAIEAFFFQTVFYLVTLAALYGIVVLKHARPFWPALGWTLNFRGAWWCVLSAPLLIATISLLAEFLRAPIIPSPWQDLIAGKGSQFLVMIFATILGPFWEELLFRGFLFPLLQRSFGPWLAILGAAIPFGVIHGAQNQWVWQYVVLVAVSGIAFGLARYRTGSTAAATLTHSAYNSALFLVFLIQHL
jgi:membrane protease YdiL (CAAX protease family)